MTSKIFLYNENEITAHYIHEVHEHDMIDFLIDHNGRMDIPTHCDNLKWFEIILTNKDIKEIKKTFWYTNEVWNNKKIINELNEGTKLEAFILEYIPE